MKFTLRVFLEPCNPPQPLPPDYSLPSWKDGTRLFSIITTCSPPSVSSVCFASEQQLLPPDRFKKKTVCLIGANQKTFAFCQASVPNLSQGWNLFWFRTLVHPLRFLSCFSTHPVTHPPFRLLVTLRPPPAPPQKGPGGFSSPPIRFVYNLKLPL